MEEERKESLGPHLNIPIPTKKDILQKKGMSLS